MVRVSRLDPARIQASSKRIEGEHRRLAEGDGQPAGDERQSDHAEGADGTGAVEPGRLVEFGRDALQGREQDDGRQRQHPPDMDDRDQEKGRRVVVEPDVVFLNEAAILSRLFRRPELGL